LQLLLKLLGLIFYKLKKGSTRLLIAFALIIILARWRI